MKFIKILIPKTSSIQIFNPPSNPQSLIPQLTLFLQNIIHYNYQMYTHQIPLLKYLQQTKHIHDIHQIIIFQKKSNILHQSIQYISHFTNNINYFDKTQNTPMQEITINNLQKRMFSMKKQFRYNFQSQGVETIDEKQLMEKFNKTCSRENQLIPREKFFQEIVSYSRYERQFILNRKKNITIEVLKGYHLGEQCNNQ